MSRPPTAALLRLAALGLLLLCSWPPPCAALGAARNDALYDPLTSPRVRLVAASATFGLVDAIAVAADGTLYVADGTSRKFQKISPAGVATDVLVAGTSGYHGAYVNGMVLNAAGTHLFVTDNPSVAKVLRVDVSTTPVTVQVHVPGGASVQVGWWGGRVLGC